MDQGSVRRASYLRIRWPRGRRSSSLPSRTAHSPVGFRLASLRWPRAPVHDSHVKKPETSYAWSDGTAIAYQVVESSGPDLLFVPGSVTHLEVQWEEPRVRRFFTRLASFSRLILMDPRGLGLSDRLTEVPTVDERVADLLSVLDATETERATLFGNADTGPACIAAAALHPDRVDGLILLGTYAKGSWSEDEIAAIASNDQPERDRAGRSLARARPGFQAVVRNVEPPRGEPSRRSAPG